MASFDLLCPVTLFLLCLSLPCWFVSTFSKEGKVDVGLAEVYRGAEDRQTWRPMGELEPDRVPCANALMC